MGDHYEQMKIDQDNAQRERILRNEANKDKCNEISFVQGQLTGKSNEIASDYAVQLPQAYLVHPK